MDTDAEEGGARNPWGRLEAVALTGIVVLVFTFVLAGTDVREACGHLALWVGPFACIFAFLAFRSEWHEGRAPAMWAAARYGIMTGIAAGRALLPDPVGIDVAFFGSLGLTLFEAVPGVRAALRHNRENPMPRLRP
jgi:hypothetical protein